MCVCRLIMGFQPFVPLSMGRAGWRDDYMTMPIDSGGTATAPRERRHLWRRSVAISLIVMSMLGLLWATLTLIERRLIHSSGEILSVLASEVVAKLDLLMMERQGDVKILASTLGLPGWSQGGKEDIISNFHENFPYYLWIGITDPIGRIVVATDPASVGSSAKATEWFQAIQNGKQVRLHAGYLPGDGYAGESDSVSLTAPIWAQQTTQSRTSLLGVVSARVRLPQIEGAIMEAIRGFQGQSELFGTIEYQVLRDDGLVLIDSDLLHKGGAVNLKQAGLPSALQDRIGHAGFIAEEHARRHVAVVTGYADSRWNRDFGISGWRVLLRVDQAEIVASFRQIVWMIGFGVCLVMLPIIGWLLRRIDLGRASLLVAEQERSRARKNERWLRSILEAEPEGIFVIGEGNLVQETNPAACALFESDFSDEMVGRPVQEFIHADDRSRIEAAFQAAWAGRRSRIKGRILTLTGQLRWVEITSAPLPTDDGSVPSMLCVVRDITEQERADHLQMLQHAVARVLAEVSTLEQAAPDLLRAITASLGWDAGLFWLVDDDQGTLSCNHQWPVPGATTRDFITASRHSPIALGSRLAGRCWEQGEAIWVPDLSQQPELWWGSADMGDPPRTGYAIPIWLRAKVFGVMEFFSQDVRQPDKDLLNALAIAGSQIGLFIERAEVEAALRTSETRTRLIIDTALDAVISMDQVGQITEWNAQAERIFGWSAYDVIGSALADLVISPAHRQEYDASLRRLHDPKDGLTANMLVEMVAVRRDGSEFPIELAMTSLSLDNNVIFSAFIRDITSRKEAEHALKDYAQQLERINQQLDVALKEAHAATEAKSLFLATMSHEIRTPMNGVIGLTGLLLETSLTDEQREYADSVRTCGDHLLTIINDILDFSKIEAGKLNLEMIEFDLRLAIEESLDLVAERASSKGLNLACLFHADVPRNLLGDPGRLRQIVVNLIANAIKFTDGGDVIVEVQVDAQSQQEATIRVVVTDTGIGISEEAREKLFQSFSQVDGSMARKYGGTGLGLAICKRLVEMMGGRIEVSSQVGKGSSFWFTVNLHKQGEGIRGKESSAVALAGLRVLVVEDRAVNRKILDLMTKQWNMEPTLVTSASEALETLTCRGGHPAFDLVLLDIDLGETDGIELARTIKSQDQGVTLRIVLLTSLGRRGDAKKAREAGLAAYLTKPIRERQLHDCLVAVMAQCSASIHESGTADLPPLITRHTLAENKARVELRILLAEDNIINQKVAVRLFQRLGHRIDVVANGLEAVEALSRIHYDAVFMDCQMPEMDGFEATRLIREREQAALLVGRPNDRRFATEGAQGTSPGRIPIIAMTANAMQGDRERCLEAGMDDYLTKPISSEALAGALARVNGPPVESELGTIRDAA